MSVITSVACTAAQPCCTRQEASPVISSSQNNGVVVSKPWYTNNIRELQRNSYASSSWSITPHKALSITYPECEAASTKRKAAREDHGCVIETIDGAAFLLAYRESGGYDVRIADAGSTSRHSVELDEWPPEPGKKITINNGLTWRCSVWFCTYERIQAATFHAGATPYDWKVVLEYVSPNVYPQELRLLNSEIDSPKK